MALGAGALLLLAGASRRSAIGACLAVSSTPLLYRGITGRWPDVLDGHMTRSARAALGGERGVHVRESVRLEVPVADVYRFWRRLDNLPLFMTHLNRVTTSAGGRSHWEAGGPAGLAVEWDAEIINEIENQVLAWRSLPGSDVVTAGSVKFDAAREGRSTQVSVHLQYAPAGWKGGRVGGIPLRSRAVADHPRGSSTLQATARSRRDSPSDGHGVGASRCEPSAGKAKRRFRSRPFRIRIILNPRDAIVKVTTTAICGSDLHIYDGYIPTMQKGDVLGHEFMGEVVEVGTRTRALKVGDRVVVPFTIACGRCYFCKEQLWSLCDNSNPNAWMAEKLYGYSASGLFGYSHMYGGYPGGQAEYARVPFADIGPLKVPDSLTDEQVLFLSDIFPTGYMAADNCQIKPGDTVAVWGCGPVGQFAIKSAYLLGAERVIAIDRFAERLALASSQGGADTLNYEDVDVLDALRHLTGGQGPDACIDAVGLEAHGTTLDAWYDRAKTSMFLATDRPHALRQAISACRKGGTVSIPGVYGGWLDKFPLGAAFAKGLTLKMGQTHMHKYHADPARTYRAWRDRPLVHHYASHRARRRTGDVPHVPRQGRLVHQSRHQTGYSSRHRHGEPCSPVTDTHGEIVTTLEGPEALARPWRKRATTPGMRDKSDAAQRAT